MVKVCIEFYTEEKIYLNIYEQVAPKAAQKFLSLVDSGFYKDVVFHRIIKGFMCQAGGYRVNENSQLTALNGGSPIIGEFANNGFNNTLHHGVGVISMARTNDPNSASSQFFICSADCGFLDGNYAAFGRVSDMYSYDVLMRLENLATQNVGGGFENYPAVSAKFYTIKDIKRV